MLIHRIRFFNWFLLLFRS